MSIAGNLWLKKHFELEDFHFSQLSYIGSKNEIERLPNNQIKKTFTTHYQPNDNIFDQMIFSIKHEDLNLCFLSAVFEKVTTNEMKTFVSSSPNGKYHRSIGFLFEFLTVKTVDFPDLSSGNYFNLLDNKKYYTGKITKNKKWRININFLGTKEYCPIVRKTDTLIDQLAWDISKDLIEIENSFPEDIYIRATNYLYSKETKSSYQIEKEVPTMDRMERFIKILSKAGTSDEEALLSEDDLKILQNAIVDPRFANDSFRDFQNYVGESLPNFIENIHYICPQPELVKSLMKGLKCSYHIARETHPFILATIVSFGYVFIHPFEDGNGRIHRFLIHDILVRTGLFKEGFIIPVSAYMLNNPKEYDKALEAYSKPLMKIIEYLKNPQEEVEITNKALVTPYYKYPDLTEQVSFVTKIIKETLNTDLPKELKFIQCYDELKKSIQNIVDMPDKMISNMILFLHQNKGVFPKRRRKQFEKLTDEEITNMEKAYLTIFEV